MGNGLKPFKENSLSFAYEPLINPKISVEPENENLRVFSFKELKKATDNFKQERAVIRNDGSIRTYYNAYINKTTFAPSRTETGIAVSSMNGLQDSSQEWMAKMESQVKLSHPNLVKLLGYSCEDNKSIFLVFECLRKGSLDRHIFGKEEVLPWDIRVNIAIQTAQGIAFLHSIKNSSVNQEIRMHNIMLDEQYNAKLFYVESNQQVFIGEQCQFFRETEYLAPEFAMTGRLGMEADVYTFGVILLELFSGLKALDIRRNKDKQNLAFWAKSFLSDKIGEIIDPRLGNDYPVKAATRMGYVIKGCIKQDVKIRPIMQHVLEALNFIANMKK